METNNKKRIAIFESKAGQFAGEESIERWEGYARVSEYVEVEFKPLQSDEVIRNKIALIDKKLHDLFIQVEQYNQQKQELLALEYIDA